MPNPSSQAINDLRALPFSTMIGGPLTACVRAQRQAAVSTIEFIRDVGLGTKKDEKGNLVRTNEVINVSFLYMKDGQRVELTVPLLTIVPIPYIAIDTININFKASLSGTTASHTEWNYSDSKERTMEDNNFSGNPAEWGSTDKDGEECMAMKGTISTKRDSKSTRDSNYSIEATIDINVNAHAESMPAGMAKVLEMLNQAIMLQPASSQTPSNPT